MMQRRNFLKLGAISAVAVVIPTHLSAIDFRQTKPDVWTADNVNDAIKNMYGDITPIYEGITLNVPSSANNGKTVPIGISSNIQANSLAVFQNANPEATVVVYTIHENSVIDYSLKIKMQKGPREVTVILEGKDGKFYASKKHVVVADGGCEG